MKSFDPEIVRALAAILNETGLSEIEVTDKDSRVRVARAAAPAAAQIFAPPPPSPVPVPPLTPLPDVAPIPPVTVGEAVTSPMVGIVYLAPEPGAPPYVTPGQQVAAGQTVLLIEAMKTFNQVKAPRTGTVTRILIDSGMPVEFGEPLLVIE